VSELSFPEMEVLNEINYVPQERFLVHLPDFDFEFHHRGKLFVGKREAEKRTYVTSSETEAVFMKLEDRPSEKAHELIKIVVYRQIKRQHA
jgi:hypothetical protein